jgi:hypothetical protein
MHTDFLILNLNKICLNLQNLRESKIRAICGKKTTIKKIRDNQFKPLNPWPIKS